MDILRRLMDITRRRRPCTTRRLHATAITRRPHDGARGTAAHRITRFRTASVSHIEVTETPRNEFAVIDKLVIATASP